MYWLLDATGKGDAVESAVRSSRWHYNFVATSTGRPRREMTGISKEARRGAKCVDIGLLLIMLLTGGAIAYWLVAETPALFFYQTLMPSSIAAACGRGFAEPASIPPALHDFIFLQSPRFDCGALNGVQMTAGLSAMAKAHLYLLSLVVALWTVGGVSYSALWPLAAALHGAYVAAGYMLGRLFLARWAATILALLLSISPLATAVMASSIRDYAKAPFLLWSLVLLVWAFRANNTRSLVTIGAILGLVVGLGTGFRSDVVEVLPLGIFALTIAQWRGPVTIAGRLGATTVFLTVSMGLMAPLQTLTGATGALWMQGASEPYRWELHLPPAPYDLGERYSDELTYSGIAADLRRPDPAHFDSGEALPGEQTQAQRLSTVYVSRWVDLFLADIATRSLASVWWIAGMPALLTLPQPSVVLYDVVYPAKFVVSQWAAPVVAVLARPWTPVIGILGLISIVWRVFARAPREAAALTVILSMLMAFPSLQFALRHLFHLEALFWLSLLSLVTLPWTFGRPRSSFLGFAAWASAVVLLVGGVYAGLIFWQDRALHREIAALLVAPSEALPLDAVSLGDGRIMVAVTSLPSDAAGLFGGPSDAATLREGPTHFDSVRAAASRMILEVGPGCPAAHLALQLSYEKLPNAWQDFDRSILVPVPAAGLEPTIVVVPVFYRPDQAFRGFAVAENSVNCIHAVKRAALQGRLPVIFSAVLEPGWEKRPLHLELGGERGSPPPR